MNGTHPETRSERNCPSTPTIDAGGDELTGADSPPVGIDLEYQASARTHRAHVRYAASDTPGVVWYDPRDGRERYTLTTEGSDSATESTSVTVAAFDGMDDRVLTSVIVRPHRPGAAVDGKYLIVRNYARLETFRRFHAGRHIDSVVRVGACVDSTVVDSLEAAREHCREHVPGYADAPRRDAVFHRLVGDGSV